MHENMEILSQMTIVSHKVAVLKQIYQSLCKLQLLFNTLLNVALSPKKKQRLTSSLLP